MAKRAATPPSTTTPRAADLEDGEGAHGHPAGQFTPRKYSVNNLLEPLPKTTSMAEPLPEMKESKKGERIFGLNPLLVSGTSYVLTSSAMVLLNKHALSSFHFQCPHSLLFFHCLVAVFLVKSCEVLGYVKLEPLRWDIVRIWMPVNLIFVGMTATSFLALQSIGVGMFTVLKNMSNLLTIVGDYVWFGKTYPWQVWSCLGLMVMSAFMGAGTDTRFTFWGYFWQLLNCVFTAAYALYLSGAMDRVANVREDGKRMSESSMVYYNNLLSLGPIAALAIGFGEVPVKLMTQQALHNPEFLMVALAGALLGFGISFSSLWYMSRSSATVFSLTGSMNKVVVALAGILLFHEAAGFWNLVAIGIGLLAGVIFVVAKMKH